MSNENVFVIPPQLAEVLKRIHDKPRYRQDLSRIYEQLYLILMRGGELDLVKYEDKIESNSSAASSERITQSIKHSLFENSNDDLARLLEKSPDILKRMVLVVYRYDDLRPVNIHENMGSTDSYVVDPFQDRNQGEYGSLVIIGTLVSSGIRDIWRYLNKADYMNQKLIVVMDDSWYLAFKQAIEMNGLTAIETENPTTHDWSNEILACTKPAFSSDFQMSEKPQIKGFYRFE